MTAPEHFLLPTYARADIALVRGEGAWVWDDAGRRYLDFTSGIGVASLGHAHPALAAAVAEQARTLVHCSNLFRIPQQELLAERLCRLAGMDGAFFCNSGAEANEAAIKLVRRAAREAGRSAPVILALAGSFHGRTLGALAATMQPRLQRGFEPLPAGFRAIEAPTEEALDAAWNDNVAAVMLEPIQGEGGVRPLPEDFLRAVRRRCDEAGAWLVLDEVQTGIGRTGAWFAFGHAGVAPDAITLAKGLGGGFPIGALLARGALARGFAPGAHGSTFGGNPLACRAALAVLEVMERENVPAHAARLGEVARQTLEALAARMDCVREVRGRGLMWGLELDREAGAVVAAAREEGLLALTAGSRVVRLLPPLVLAEEELMDGIARLSRALERTCGTS